MPILREVESTEQYMNDLEDDMEYCDRAGNSDCPAKTSWDAVPTHKD
jgi:hypothetical protein